MTVSTASDDRTATDTETSNASDDDRLTGWWVWIEKDADWLPAMPQGAAAEVDVNDADAAAPTVAIGPYPTEDAAGLAMEEALLIQGLVEENCTECWYDDKPPVLDPQLPTGAHAPEDPDVLVSVQIIDPANPDHTGAQQDDTDE